MCFTADVAFLQLAECIVHTIRLTVKVVCADVCLWCLWAGEEVPTSNGLFTNNNQQILYMWINLKIYKCT